MNLKRISYFLLILLGLGATTARLNAQEANQLTLRLTRDFGYGAGGDIQGTFSYRVDGPDNLERIVFLLDGEPIAEDSEVPFRYQFKTEEYDVGLHTMSAIGYTSDGQELTSNSITRNFISGSASLKNSVILVGGILILILGGRYLSSRISNRGRDKKTANGVSIDGPYGGTICKHCNKPFARHWWGFNLVTGKYDRCPHCHKWSMTQRIHPDLLAASLEAMQMADAQESKPSSTNAPDDDLHRRLDDSRFN